MTTADARWSAGLEAWAIPQELIDAAPQSPWGFEPQVFIGLADDALARQEDSPSDARARSALPPGGTVLDVGAGAGAAGLRLHDTAGRIVAVDPSAALLEAFTQRARGLEVEHEAILGRWPDAAPQAPRADVVTCHHVTYNVPELAAFATALDAHAGRRVVIEMTTRHPLSWMAPLWESLHGLGRPDRPTVEDAVAVLHDCGFAVEQEHWQRPYAVLGEHAHGSVERLARRLCLPAERHDELRALLERHPTPEARAVVTLSWDKA